MKRRALISVFFVLAGITLAALLIPQLIILPLGRKVISAALPKSKVNIRGSSLFPPGCLRLTGISISRDRLYTVSLKEVRLLYGPDLLSKKRIRKFELSGLSVSSVAPWFELTRLINAPAEYLNLGSNGTFAIDSIVLSEAACDIHWKDCVLQARLSFDVMLQGPFLRSVLLEIKRLVLSGFTLEEALVRLSGTSQPGRVYVRSMRYDRLAIEGFQGSLQQTAGSVRVSPFTLRFLSGTADGSLELATRMPLSCSLECNLAGISLERAVRDLKLADRIDLSGSLFGHCSMALEGTSFSRLEGDFSLLEPGGSLTITDTSFLDSLAKSSQQPLEMIMESFRDYRYNSGKARLASQEGNLVLEVSLDGAQGKRSLNVVWHDFRLIRRQGR